MTVTGLTADVVYSFRVYSRNVVGTSLVSNQVAIRAAAKPDTPVAPTTTINNDYVDVTWESVYNGGSPLTAYTITI